MSRRLTRALDAAIQHEDDWFWAGVDKDWRHSCRVFPRLLDRLWADVPVGRIMPAVEWRAPTRRWEGRRLRDVEYRPLRRRSSRGRERSLERQFDRLRLRR